MNHSLTSLLEGLKGTTKGESKHDIPAQAGIYVLLCNVNNKPYVGRSVNLRNRFQEHINPTYRQTNGTKLSNAKDLHGVESFSFYVVETCDCDELAEREDFYIEELDSVVNGYNIRHISEKFERWTLSDEQKAQISTSLKEYYQNNENPFKGKKHSDESRELIKKNVRNEDGSLKQHWSEETRERMRGHGKEMFKTLRGWMDNNPHPRNRHVVMMDKKTGEELAVFFSIRYALEHIGKDKEWGGITNVVRGRGKTAAGYGWKYLNS